MATVPWNVFPAGIKCGKNLAVIISSVHGTSLNGHQIEERESDKEKERESERGWEPYGESEL